MLKLKITNPTTQLYKYEYITQYSIGKFYKLVTFYHSIGWNLTFERRI